MTSSKGMEIKKEEWQGSAIKEKKKESDLLKARDFIEGIKTEFKNITWTSKEELRVYTKIVVGATFLFGLSVYFADVVIQSLLNSLTWITRLMVG
jgi:preprotein translocase subunit SecE